jgi:hypothetical protein
MTISASRALYIKLGEGNCWTKLSFETNTLRFGFSEISHEMALAAVEKDDFTAIRDFYRLERAVASGTATRYSNEMRSFYTTGPDVLWITFADGRLWWCFADPTVMPTLDVDPSAAGSKYRNSVGKWSDKDINGQTLWTNALRGSLTTTAGFRGTICRVSEFDYLIRRLNGEETVATAAARHARQNLIEAIIPLIRGLHWRDFELLVELVMTQGGWRRVSATGGTQHTTDLELELPLTGEPALVQVKSRLDQITANKVTSELVEAAGNARIFVAYHTSPGPLVNDQENVSLIGPDELAEHVVELGLTGWIMNKVG